MVHPNDKFGENTIERAFLDDVEYQIDTKGSTEVVCGEDEYDISVVQLELAQSLKGIANDGERKIPVVSAVYVLTVAPDMDVHRGDDVFVNGYEYVWRFNNVDIAQQENDGTTVATEEISKIQG